MQIYESFSDDDLLLLIQIAAKRVNRVPAISDLHYIYARYIKRRFGSFENALGEAGYKRETRLSVPVIRARLSDISDNELAAVFVYLCAKELKDHRPSKHSGKEALRVLEPLFGTVAAAKKALDTLRMAEDQYYPTVDAAKYGGELFRLKEKAKELGRTPLRSEINARDGGKLWLAFGSWNRILVHAGLSVLAGGRKKHAKAEYMIKTAGIKNLRHKYLNSLTDDDVRCLEEYCAAARRLKRMPSLEEAGIPADTPERTKHLFGSWRALLLQIGLPINI